MLTLNGKAEITLNCPFKFVKTSKECAIKLFDHTPKSICADIFKCYNGPKVDILGFTWRGKNGEWELCSSPLYESRIYHILEGNFMVLSKSQPSYSLLAPLSVTGL